MHDVCDADANGRRCGAECADGSNSGVAVCLGLQWYVVVRTRCPRLSQRGCAGIFRCWFLRA